MAGKTKNFVYPFLINEMKKNGETQKELAKTLGLTRESVNFRFSGKREWTISEIEKICKHYNKDFYELFRKE